MTLLTFYALLQALRTLRRDDGRSLRELDDRTLADIGIDRSEIDSIVAEVDGRAEPARRRITFTPHRA